jgi:hypothetical protein
LLKKIVEKSACNYVNMLNNPIWEEPEYGGFDWRGKGVVLAISTPSGELKNKVL